MMRRTFVILFLATSVCTAAENLNQADFVGVWRSHWTAVDGESDTPEIATDFAVKFSRRFESEYPDQNIRASSENFRFVDDIAIVEFRDDTGKLHYKLVLSGWKTKSTRRLFGTMFMYRDGHLFNGLPIALEASVENES